MLSTGNFCVQCGIYITRCLHIRRLHQVEVFLLGRLTAAPYLSGFPTREEEDSGYDHKFLPKSEYGRFNYKV